VEPHVDFNEPTKGSIPLGFKSSTKQEAAAQKQQAGGTGRAAADNEKEGAKGAPGNVASLREQAEELKADGKYLIGAIVKEVAPVDLKTMVEVKWYGFPDDQNSPVELTSLAKEAQVAWKERPHKNPGLNGAMDTSLYICDRPNEHGINTRKYNYFDNPVELVAEMKDFYGEDEAECNTKKDNSESVLRTAGNMYAVSNCGIIYLVRELYR